MEHEQTPTIVVFSTSYLPYIGGAEIAIYEIAKRCPSFRFVIVTARGSGRPPRFERHDHIEIRRLGLGMRFDKWLLPILAFFAASRIVLRESHVLLWGMMLSQGSIAAYVTKLFFPRVPFIVTLQEGDSEEYIRNARFGLIHFFWRRILKKADGATAISVYLARKAQEAGFHREVPIIPNGVDEHFVSEAFEAAPTELFKKELGIAREQKVVLSVSRLVHKNGIADILRAFSLIRERGIDAVLVLVGSGEEEGRLRDLSRALRISRDVVFAGSVPHDDVLRYYRMSDVFVRPSYSEGLGISFLEALGAGVPVVATPVGGIADFIEDGVTGIFALPGEPATIALGIERILSDAGLAEKLRVNGREVVIQKFLWVDIAKRMERIFNERIV